MMGMHQQGTEASMKWDNLSIKMKKDSKKMNQLNEVRNLECDLMIDD